MRPETWQAITGCSRTRAERLSIGNVVDSIWNDESDCRRANRIFTEDALIKLPYQKNRDTKYVVKYRLVQYWPSFESGIP